ncbi:MAG: tetratricopeptide repeat protein [Candidatus Dormiibacterota bacterium]
MLLATYYWTNGDTDSAWNALKAAAHASVGATSSLLAVANQQLQYAAYNGARSTLRSVPPVDRSYQWLFAEGQVDAVLGTVAQVNLEFQRAIELTPLGQRANWLLLIGNTWLSQGQYIQALASYEQATLAQGQVDAVQLQLQIATTETLLGDPTEAASVYEKVLTMGVAGTRRQNVEIALARDLVSAGEVNQALVLLKTLLRSKLGAPTRIEVQALIDAIE